MPPLMILSVTRRCNLRCAGCFVHEQARPVGNELSSAELRTILRDARDLGVSMVALAGGEPLTRPEILDIAADFPELLFPLVTNGSLLDDALLTKLQKLRNVIPVISLEGLEFETDGRRGSGVYQRALDAMAKMQQRRIFFGTSIMITRRNFGLVTSRRFVRDLVDRGARLFFYVDYVPIKAGTEHLIPSQTQRGLEPFTMMLLRTRVPGPVRGLGGKRGGVRGLHGRRRGFRARERRGRSRTMSVLSLLRHQPARGAAPRGAAIAAPQEHPRERRAPERIRGRLRAVGQA